MLTKQELKTIVDKWAERLLQEAPGDYTQMFGELLGDFQTVVLALHEELQRPPSESSGDYYRRPENLNFAVTGVHRTNEQSGERQDRFALVDNFGRLWIKGQLKERSTPIEALMEYWAELPLTAEEAWSGKPDQKGKTDGMA